MAKPCTPRRIVLTRLSAIGDCVCTLPLAVRLREVYPHARIGWVIEPAGYDLLRHHPAVDEWLVLPRKWSRSLAGIRAAGRTVRSFGADLAVDPQSLAKSGLLAYLSGAKRRVGPAGVHARELSAWFHTDHQPTSKNHLVDRSLELLAALGLPTAGPRFDLTVRREDRAFAQRVRLDFDRITGGGRKVRLDEGDPPRDDTAPRSGKGQAVQPIAPPRFRSPGYVLINVGAGWPSKMWPVERWASVARRIERQWGIRSLVLWGNTPERALARQVVEQAGSAAVMAPPTTLGQMAGLLEGSLAYLGGDTGPMHVAAALGVPCVALFGPTRPEECGPYGRGHQIVQSYYQDGGRKARRSAPNHAMRAITTEMVVEAATQLLEPLLANLTNSAADRFGGEDRTGSWGAGPGRLRFDSDALIGPVSLSRVPPIRPGLLTVQPTSGPVAPSSLDDPVASAGVVRRASPLRLYTGPDQPKMGGLPTDALPSNGPVRSTTTPDVREAAVRATGAGPTSAPGTSTPRVA